ncbi:protein ORF150B [Cyprinid herpesvirus 1]|uniref:Protein ORF150B n=1 Tax=Cyprinid herpesvirus 1 TaxID=317858 RepID=K7PBE5_9VIRU|nr:protein ORF150B [Cyprinid herpesvirus 1]AFJ20439.1 protein ORF150B [Cyprinid herpesvirus 1]
MENNKRPNEESEVDQKLNKRSRSSTPEDKALLSDISDISSEDDEDKASSSEEDYSPFNAVGCLWHGGEAVFDVKPFNSFLAGLEFDIKANMLDSLREFPGFEDYYKELMKPENAPATSENKELFALGRALYRISGHLLDSPCVTDSLESLRKKLLDDSEPMHTQILQMASKLDARHEEAHQHQDDLDGLSESERLSYVRLRTIALILMRAAVLPETANKSNMVRYTCGVSGVTASAAQVCLRLGRPIVHTASHWVNHGNWVAIWWYIIDCGSLSLSDIYYESPRVQVQSPKEAAVTEPSVHDHVYNVKPPYEDLLEQWRLGKQMVELGFLSLMFYEWEQTHHMCGWLEIGDLHKELKRLRLYRHVDGVCSKRDSGVYPALYKHLVITPKQMETYRPTLTEPAMEPIINESMFNMALARVRTHKGMAIKRLGHSLTLAAHMGLEVKLCRHTYLHKQDITQALCDHAQRVSAQESKTRIDLTVMPAGVRGTVTCKSYYTKTTFYDNDSWVVKVEVEVTSPPPDVVVAKHDAELLPVDAVFNK